MVNCRFNYNAVYIFCYLGHLVLHYPTNVDSTDLELNYQYQLDRLQ